MNRMKLTLVGFIFIDEKVRIKSGFDEGDVQ